MIVMTLRTPCTSYKVGTWKGYKWWSLGKPYFSGPEHITVLGVGVADDPITSLSLKFYALNLSISGYRGHLVGESSLALIS